MRMTLQQIMRLINEYIGVENGYLGSPPKLRFSYQTHKKFYPQYCGLDIDPDKIEAKTTRERFIHILSNASPKNQAKIIRGILERFPLDLGGDQYRTEEIRKLDKRITLHKEYEELADDLEKSNLDDLYDFSDNDIVIKSIEGARILIKEQGAKYAIDRVHTAFHAYLQSICTKAGIPYEKGVSITAIFKNLRKSHPVFLLKDNFSEESRCIIQAFSSIIDAMNPLRNHKSLAHPNSSLLEDEEAVLCIDAAITCMKYFAAITSK